MFKQAVSTYVLNKKNTFTGVVQGANQKHREEVERAMNKFPYFGTWAQETKDQCAIYSAVKMFPPKSLIEVRYFCNAAQTHFILEGSCIAIRKLTVQRQANKSGKFAQYQLYKLENGDSKKNNHVEEVFMQVSRLLPGCCFGLGEELGEKCFLLAETNVQFLIIPRSFLLKNVPPNYIWQRIVHFSNLMFPTEQQLVQILQDKRKWKKHKESYIDKKHYRNNTNLSIHDVPVSCRIGHILPPKKYRNIWLKHKNNLFFKLNEGTKVKEEEESTIQSTLPCLHDLTNERTYLSSLIKSENIPANVLEEIIKNYFGNGGHSNPEKNNLENEIEEGHNEEESSTKDSSGIVTPSDMEDEEVKEKNTEIVDTGGIEEDLMFNEGFCESQILPKEEIYADYELIWAELEKPESKIKFRIPMVENISGYDSEDVESLNDAI